MISENQRNRSNSGIINGDGNGNIINYSFLILIDLYDSFRGEYRKLKWFYTEGNNNGFDFSNTLKDLREFLYYFFDVGINDMIYYINICGTLKLWFTFKDILLYRTMNNYINNYIEEPRREEESEEESEEEREEPVINAEQTFKSDECVICLTNPPVLFCNCRLCLCIECDEVKSLKICPVCKTETTIKRTI